MPTNILGIISLFIAFLNIVLGVIVFFRNPRKANNIVYAIIVSSIAIWIIFTYLYNNPFFLEPEVWLKIVYIASYGMLIAQMIFAYYFPKKTETSFLPFSIPIILSMLPSIYVLLFQDSVIEGVVNDPEKHMSIAQMGSGYFIYTIPNTLGILLLVIYFLRKSKSFIGYEKAQIRFYILGALLMMVPLVIVDYGIPLINGDTSFFVYGPLFAIPFSISLAYSILTTRFITITNLLKKTLDFLSKLGFGALSLFLCIKWYQGWEGNTSNLIVFLLIFTTLSLFVYVSVYKKLIGWLASKIFKESKAKELIIKNFIQISNMELTMDNIFINIRRTIRDILNINKVGIILFDKNDSDIRYNQISDFTKLESRDLLDIVRYWDDIASDPIIVSDEIKREAILNEDRIPERFKKVIDFMDSQSISAILPFNSRTRLNGVILLGYREDAYPLTIEDIETLDELIVNISVSIGRAVLYQEVQEFNETLKDKVREQTEELQVKVKELEDARRKERDMIDIMGHELRTPATVVKLNIDLLNKYVDSNPVEFKKYLDRMKTAIENEIKLISTLLSSAKLEGNKIEINSEEVDLVEEIDMCIHGHEKEAEDKGLKIINNAERNLPKVFADKARTIEILNNLLDNAVKYTERGSITLLSQIDDNFVHISIVDTGSGILEKDIPKLGQKFYRAENYINGENLNQASIVRPGGTGLGLFVTFNLVKLMGGDISVESEFGKGSKFTFKLPIYKNQDLEKKKSISNNMFERMGLKK